MKTKLARDPRCIDLLVDTNDPNDRQVLASLNEMADADCWFIIDIRLLERPQANAYSGSANAEDFCAHIKPGSVREADFYTRNLRDYRLQDDGTIIWCTYQNIRHGEKSVGGYTPPKSTEPSIYMTLEQGLQAMKEIRAFWEGYEGEISKAKVENPFRQPRQTELYYKWLSHDLSLEP